MSGVGWQPIFAPMGAMALLTFTVLLIVPVVRLRAVLRGALRVDDFRAGEPADAPAWVSIPNRNYMNLLELPTLFYAICLMFALSGAAPDAALRLAWGYVALRALHSAIHLTVNHVPLRLAAFALGNAVLAALWGLFFAS